MAVKHQAAEESDRLASELMVAKVQAADAAETYRVAQSRAQTTMVSRGDDLERMGRQVGTLEEALSVARKNTQDEKAAREDSQVRMATLERRLVADSGAASSTTAAALDVMNRLKEESERLLAESQQEVQDSHAECDQTWKQLKAAELRVAQLQDEVVRLQKHEHALHALIGAAE
jgi:chromosome segregation ATPase